MEPNARGCVCGSKSGPSSESSFGVEADRSPRLLERVEHVLFAGHEIERAGLCVVGQDEIEKRVVLRLSFRFRHLRDRLAVIFLQIWIEHSGNQHAGTAAAVEKKIFPILVVDGHFALDPRPRRGVAQSLEQFVRAAIGDPRRQ